jgi:hypothetical protein
MNKNEKLTSKTTVAEVRAMAREDGFEITSAEARQILAAHKKGALVWTRDRITTTDASRLDLRPTAWRR